MLHKSLCGLLSLLVLVGCARPVAHRYSVDPSIPEDAQWMNARAKGRDLRVEFITGRHVSVRDLALGPDSTSFVLPGIWRPGREPFGSGLFRIAPTDSIRGIGVLMRKEATLVTTAGLAAGGALVSLLAFHALANALNEEKHVGYDIRFAIPGFIGGAV